MTSKHRRVTSRFALSSWKSTGRNVAAEGDYFEDTKVYKSVTYLYVSIQIIVIYIFVNKINSDTFLSHLIKSKSLFGV